MKKQKQTIKYLGEDEISAFFNATKKQGNIQHQLIFKLMFHCGLRVRECVNIQLQDLHPQLLQIFINRVKDGISLPLFIRPDDQKLLKRWLKIREKYPNANGNPYLFITKRSLGGSMTMINVFKAHEKYCKLAGIPKEKQHTHVWRHSAAITLLKSGHDIKTVKDFLGHKSLQSTLVYTNLMPQDWVKVSQRAVNSFPV